MIACHSMFWVCSRIFSTRSLPCEHQLNDGQVRHLGTDRVEFPVDFLEHEIDFFPDRLALASTRPSHHMGFQPHHLFVDVAFEEHVGKIARASLSPRSPLSPLRRCSVFVSRVPFSARAFFQDRERFASSGRSAIPCPPADCRPSRSRDCSSFSSARSEL